MNDNITVLYQLSTLGKIKEWTIMINKNTITTIWGYIDGAKQSTTDIIFGKNIGRANATSNEEQARLEFERRIKEKLHLGMVRSLEEAKNSKKVIDEDFFINPPDSLSLPKPVNSISDKKKYKENFIVQRKLDGCRAHAFIGTNNVVQLKSRTMKEDKSFHFPQIISQLKNIGVENTILDGEIVVLDSNGLDDFELVTSIWRSDVDKALKKSKGVNILYVIFDIPFLEGNDLLATVPYKDRQLTASNLVGSLGPNIKVIDNLDLSVKDAERLAKESSWEGLVLWHPNATHDGAWTLNGKPKRPTNFCYKNKIKQDFDVIVDSWEYGKGKNKNVLGKWTNSYMICPETGKKILICDVGGGMSDEQRKEFMDLNYPVVIKVECDKINPNGSLRFPVFKSLHEAKLPNECIMDESIYNKLSKVRYLEDL